MKFVNVNYNLSIELKENNKYELILEKPAVMSEVVHMIIDQQNGNDGDFILSDGDKELKIEKNIDIVIDPFNMSVNTKKILTKLYSNAEKVAETECIIEKAEINTLVISTLDKITLSLGYTDVEYSLDYKWSDLFKIYDLKIIDAFENLLDKLCLYIRLLADFTDVKILFLVHIKDYLSFEELRELYQCASYSKIYLILIEARDYEEKNGEKRFIIDKDHCLIEA